MSYLCRINLKTMIRGKKITHSLPNKISLRDIILTKIYVLGEHTMKYSGNSISNEEELNTELLHYQFLKKYNLL